MKNPIRPGLIVKEELNALRVDIFEAAILADIPHWHLDGLIKGEHGINTSIAEGLSRLFGTSKESWLNLQEDYDKYTVKFPIIVVDEETFMPDNKMMQENTPVEKFEHLSTERSLDSPFQRFLNSSTPHLWELESSDLINKNSKLLEKKTFYESWENYKENFKNGSFVITFHWEKGPAHDFLFLCHTLDKNTCWDLIAVTLEDEPSVREFLKKHGASIKKLWESI